MSTEKKTMQDGCERINWTELREGGRVCVTPKTTWSEVKKSHMESVASNAMCVKQFGQVIFICSFWLFKTWLDAFCSWKLISQTFNITQQIHKVLHVKSPHLCFPYLNLFPHTHPQASTPDIQNNLQKKHDFQLFRYISFTPFWIFDVTHPKSVKLPWQ